MRFNAARGFVGGAASHRKKDSASQCTVSMPHAALWVVQQYNKNCPCACLHIVSMPHAALWVVQLKIRFGLITIRQSFNAARGFVGGAASKHLRKLD